MSQLSNLRLARRWVAAEPELVTHRSFNEETRCYCATGVIRRHLAGGIIGAVDWSDDSVAPAIRMDLGEATWDELYAFIGFGRACDLAEVNDGRNTTYQQATVRDRCTAYLDDEIAKLVTA